MAILGQKRVNFYIILRFRYVRWFKFNKKGIEDDGDRRDTTK